MPENGYPLPKVICTWGDTVYCKAINLLILQRLSYLSGPAICMCGCAFNDCSMKQKQKVKETTCWPLAALLSVWCWAPGCLCWAGWSCSSSCGGGSSTTRGRAETRTGTRSGSPTCSSQRSPCSWPETSARPQTRDSGEESDGNLDSALLMNHPVTSCDWFC